MNECNFTFTPTQDKSLSITHNEVLQILSNQMTDTFFYLSLIFLSYVLINMFVLNENSRFRKYFDILNEDRFIIKGVGSVGSLLVVIIQSVALFSVLILVIMNITYRNGLNI